MLQREWRGFEDVQADGLHSFASVAVEYVVEQSAHALGKSQPQADPQVQRDEPLQDIHLQAHGGLKSFLCLVLVHILNVLRLRVV